MSFKKLLLGALSCLFLTIGHQTKASNFSAADLTFKCLGGNKYEFTLTLFSDCGESKNIPDSAKIEYNAISCSQLSSFYIKKVSEQIVSSCKTEKSQCEGGNKIGFYKSVYKGSYTLPLVCNDWVFAWQRCFRDRAITNTGSQECIYVETTLNNKDAICNNSPTFINEPISIPYLDSDHTVSFSAIDVDGDRLEYTLVSPKSGLNTPVKYLAGFTASNPLTSSPLAKFNPTLGELSIHPTKLERSPVAVTVKEYRNNKLISSITRDLVIAVTDGNNVPPTISGISGSFEVQANANTEICFNISASDANAGQLVELDWDKSITGATFTSGSPSASPSGRFCWTPQESDIGTKTFTVIAKDNACPPTTSQKVITIKVSAPLCKLSVGYSVNGYCFNSPTRITVGTPIGTPVSWLWEWGNGKTATTKDPGSMTYEAPGQYTIKLTMKDAAGCQYVNTRSIVICSPPVADYIVTGQCEEDTISIEEISPIVTGCSIRSRVLKVTSPTGTVTEYTMPEPKGDIQLPSSGEHTFSMVVTSVSGCSSAAVIKTVMVYPKVEVSLPDGYSYKCNDLDTTLIPEVSGGTAPFGYLWTGPAANYRFLPSNSSSSVNINLKGNVSETFELKVTDSKGCYAESKIVIRNPLAGSFATTGYCKLGDSILFTSNIPTKVWGIKKFKWVFGDGSIDTISLNSVFHKYGEQDSVYKASLFVEDNTGCRDTLREGGTRGIIHVLPGNELSVSPNDTTCALERLNYSGPTGKYIDNYTFDFGEGSPITTTSQTGNFTYRNAGDYQLKVTFKYNDNKCTGSLPLMPIKVFPLPIVKIFREGPGCKDSLMKFDAIQTSVIGGAGIERYSWRLQNNGVTIKDTLVKNFEFPFSQKGNNSAILSVIDSNSCKSGDNASFKIYFIPKPLPVIIGHCVNSNITFGNNSTTRTRDDDVEENNTWWDMGNGDTYPLYNVIGHHYENTGTYKVVLTLYNVTNTCFDSAHYNLVIDPQPMAAFEHDSACFGNEIHFIDKSRPDTVTKPKLYMSPLKKYLWTFDDQDTISWSKGEPDSLTKINPVYTYKGAGKRNASLVLENILGCTDTATSIVTILPYPVANFTFDSEDLMAGVPIEFKDSSSGDPMPNYWYYSFGDGGESKDSNITSPTHTYAASKIGGVDFSEKQEVTQSGGKYNVTQIVKNSFGCADTITKAVDLNAYLAVPNAFSPNGDNMNDKFDIIQKGVSELTEFKVFNRWGQEIFVPGSNDLSSYWDGTYNGEDQPAGVYVYYVSAKSIYGGDMILKGNLTLLR